MIDRHDIRKVFEDLQHELEQKMMNDFPYLDYLEAEELVDSTLDKIYKEVESRELVLVKDDDLSCMEYDYEEACDRLISCGAIAKEGLAATDIEKKNVFGIDDTVMAHNKFDEILTEVES